MQLNGQSISPGTDHFTNGYLTEGGQTLVLEVNDELRDSPGAPHLLDQAAYNDADTHQKLRIIYLDTSGSPTDAQGLRTNTSGSPLGLKEDSWAINHPRILEAMAQSSQMMSLTEDRALTFMGSKSPFGKSKS